MAEWVSHRIILKMSEILERLKTVPEDLQNFHLNLRKIYFANFSLFQSIPDSWAIDQLFPILPLQRLQQKPELFSSIADITCDSDGEITSFVGEHGKTKFLPIHRVEPDEDYFIGFFLIGAYQEILGDMHNLYGDTNAVHITFNKKTNYKIDTVIKGDSISDVLKYVQHDGNEILKNISTKLEKQVALRRITIEESSYFLQLLDRTLQGYTYLGD
jgi:arginine decarboxylase